MVWTAPKLTTGTDAGGTQNLVAKVLRQYGVDGQYDAELEAATGEFVDDTIRDLNTHMYEFNKRSDTGITLSAGTETYELDAAFYKESLAYLVNTSDSMRETMLAYIPYAKWMRMYGDKRWVKSSEPVTYTLRNVNNDGLVTLGPTPDSGTASKYTLTVEYYRRIPLLIDANSQAGVEQEDPLEAAPELEVPIIYGAMKRLAIHLHGPGHPDVAGFQALEATALSEVKAADKRHPDQQQRFTLAGHGRSGNYDKRAVYIKI